MEMKDRIAKIITQKKISKTEFAKTLMISQAFVSQMCSGVAKPSDRTIADICQKFRINEKWLRTGEGDMEISDPQRAKLENFFADVLATAPDERSAFVAALDDLPTDFWPLVAELAKKYVENLKEED